MIPEVHEKTKQTSQNEKNKDLLKGYTNNRKILRKNTVYNLYSIPKRKCGKGIERRT